MPCTRPQESLTGFNLLQWLAHHLAPCGTLPRGARRHRLRRDLSLSGSRRSFNPLEPRTIDDGFEVFTGRCCRLRGRG